MELGVQCVCGQVVGRECPFAGCFQEAKRLLSDPTSYGQFPDSETSIFLTPRLETFGIPIDARNIYAKPGTSNLPSVILAILA